MNQAELFPRETPKPVPPRTRCFLRGDNLEVMKAWRGEGGFTGETYLFFSADNLRWLSSAPRDDGDVAVFLRGALPPKLAVEFLELYDWEEAVSRFRAWDGQPPRVVPFPVWRILRDTDLYCFRIMRFGESENCGYEVAEKAE